MASILEDGKRSMSIPNGGGPLFTLSWGEEAEGGWAGGRGREEAARGAGQAC